MTWWFWIILGLILSAIELATPGGFFIIFFGVAALAVGVLAVLDFAPAPWLQWLLFPVFALISLRLFRKPVMDRLGIGDSSALDKVDSLIGEIALPADAIGPGGHGHAELRGTMWSVRNVGTTPLAPGQRCRVTAVQGLMLDLRSE
jgi:inner membrane protein